MEFVNYVTNAVEKMIMVLKNVILKNAIHVLKTEFLVLQNGEHFLQVINCVHANLLMDIVKTIIKIAALFALNAFINVVLAV